MTSMFTEPLICAITFYRLHNLNFARVSRGRVDNVRHLGMETEAWRGYGHSNRIWKTVGLNPGFWLHPSTLSATPAISLSCSLLWCPPHPWSPWGRCGEKVGLHPRPLGHLSSLKEQKADTVPVPSSVSYPCRLPVQTFGREKLTQN